MGKIGIPCLCLVTDRRQCNSRSLKDVIAAAVDGGVNLVQLREKDLPAGELFRLACQLRSVTRGGALLFINDRVDVALACGADGVQLGEEGLPIPAARRMGGKLLLGRSVHSVEGALTAEAEGADLLIAGTIFSTPSHKGMLPAGVRLLDEISQHVHVPVLAIGGVNLQNVNLVISSGASGAAVITAITRSPSPERAARELMEKMKDAWRATRQGNTGGIGA